DRAPGNGTNPPAIGTGAVSSADADPGRSRTIPKAVTRMAKPNDLLRLIGTPLSGATARSLENRETVPLFTPAVKENRRQATLMRDNRLSSVCTGTEGRSWFRLPIGP